METQSHETTQKTRLEAARQAALGTLSRARETLQGAATTVPAWAREVETKAGERVDALLERVGLVRIAKVTPKPAVETAETTAEAAVTAEAAEASAAPDESAETTTGVEAATEEGAEGAAATTTTEAAPHAHGQQHASKRRRR